MLTGVLITACTGCWMCCGAKMPAGRVTASPRTIWGCSALPDAGLCGNPAMRCDRSVVFIARLAILVLPKHSIDAIAFVEFKAHRQEALVHFRNHPCVQRYRFSREGSTACKRQWQHQLVSQAFTDCCIRCNVMTRPKKRLHSAGGFAIVRLPSRNGNRKTFVNEGFACSDMRVTTKVQCTSITTH